VLLTRFFEMQYCSSPAALPGLIVLMFGSADVMGGADICASAAEAAQVSASARAGLIMILDLSGRR